MLSCFLTIAFHLDLQIILLWPFLHCQFGDFERPGNILIELSFSSHPYSDIFLELDKGAVLCLVIVIKPLYRETLIINMILAFSGESHWKVNRIESDCYNTLEWTLGQGV